MAHEWGVSLKLTPATLHVSNCTLASGLKQPQDIFNFPLEFWKRYYFFVISTVSAHYMLWAVEIFYTFGFYILYIQKMYSTCIDPDR